MNYSQLVIYYYEYLFHKNGVINIIWLILVSSTMQKVKKENDDLKYFQQ